MILLRFIKTHFKFVSFSFLGLTIVGAILMNDDLYESIFNKKANIYSLIVIDPSSVVDYEELGDKRPFYYSGIIPRVA